MLSMSCEEILRAVDGILVSGDITTSISDICTDSRKIIEGSLFVPLVGDKFDGHDFVESSFIKGAAVSLTQKDVPNLAGLEKNKTVIRVKDTLKALQDIARFYRQKFGIPFVGITGSVGKTSTKDMVASSLHVKFRVLKTEGNFNNEIGVPLTVFNLNHDHNAAVVEMGMSGFGEISRLTSIVRPDIAIITNIGMSHIEKLGSKQNILRAKMEIFEGLPSNGLVILNGDDHLLLGLKDLLKYRTVYYGMEEGLQYQAYNVKSAGDSGVSFEIAIGNKEYKVQIPVPGVHNVYNALAGIAAGIELGVPVEQIIKGIGEYSPGKMRQNVICHQGFKIINDTYSASPQSMEAAINVLKDIAGDGRTIAVLGDMLEMGEWAYDAHRGVGKYAASKDVDYLVTLGENGKNIAQGALDAGVSKDRVYSFEDNGGISQFLKGFVNKGDVILVKGSRGMKMEEIVNSLTVDM